MAGTSMRGSLGVWLGLLVLGSAGCVSVDYVGKSYAPTTNVDLYMAAGDVKRPYEVIGKANAQVEVIPFTNPSQQLQDELLAEARRRGADGIILGEVDSRIVPGVRQTVGQADTKKKGDKKTSQYTETTTTSTEEYKSLRGTLIKYATN